MSARTFSMATYIALLIGGASLGWLMGLSMNPVVQGVITALITVLVSLASVLSGLQAEGAAAEQGRRKRVAIEPWSVAALALGLAVGAPAGIVARTHAWFGENTLRISPEQVQIERQKRIENDLAFWQRHTKKDVDQLASRFLERELGAESTAGVSVEPSNASRPDVGLYSGPTVNECHRLRQADDVDLPAEMSLLAPSTLRFTVRLLCKSGR